MQENEKRKMTTDQKKYGKTKISAGKTLKCDTCGKPHTTEDCWDGANSGNDARPTRHIQQERKTDNSAQPTTTKSVEDSKY